MGKGGEEYCCRWLQVVWEAEVGEKVVVCSRTVRWWDDEIKAKIEQRRELNKRILGSEDELWKSMLGCGRR